MNLLNILNAIIVMFGLPALIGGCIYIGRNLQLLEDLKESLEELKKDFDDDHENLILMKAKIFRPNRQKVMLKQEFLGILQLKTM